MTEPPVPADVDLRDFGYMPLEVLRLRDSDLAALATGEEFKAAVLLWCVAWHQVPAASLPNDDRLLARYSGADKAWRKVKTEALRGFVECSDGRLYHATIAEKALEAWSAKAAQRARTKAATDAREAKRRAAVVGADVERHEQRDVERDVLRDVERNVVQGKGREGKGIKEQPPAVVARGRASKHVPADFSPSPELRAEMAAECPAVDLEAETRTFRDHTFATARSDWPATWRNWIRRAKPGAQSAPLETAWQRGQRERVHEMTGGLVSAKPPTPMRAVDVVEVADVSARKLG